MTESKSAGTYVPRLGLFSGTMMVVGGIIGSGIFLNPAIVAARVRSAGLTLAVWVLGGVIALIGAHLYLVVKLGTTAPPWLKGDRPKSLRKEEVGYRWIPAPYINDSPKP